MAEEMTKPIWPQPVAPYTPDQTTPVTPTPEEDKDPTGVENVSYDKVTMRVAPDKPNGTGIRKATEDGGGVDTSGSDREIKTLQDVLDRLEPQETDEQRKKRERREKSARIVSAISDGLRSLSNLYFTSQYAPSMYNHERGSQLNAQDAAIEKARAERDKVADKHLRYALLLGDAENKRARIIREAKAEQERMNLAKEKAEREAEEHEWLAVFQPDKRREQTGKADKAEYEARTARAVADNAQAMQEAELAAKEARKASYEASAANSYASARAHNRSNQPTVHHFNGKTYQKGSSDYAKDVREAARQYNERHKNDSDYQPIVTDYVEYTAYGQRLKARPVEEYAGEVETKLRQENGNIPPAKPFDVRQYKRGGNTPPPLN